ncbi:MAG: NUDIX domain-containing protein [Clostridiales bacterium]|nr:NUDIX domain-containing protein [Clostridiales bacterium]
MNTEKPGADITFVSDGARFKYRVCAVIVSDGKLLAERDEVSPYYYLPGGKVRLGETAENAVIRELREELRVEAEIVRPLYISQSFFLEEVDGLRYHELCFYYLVDVSKTDIPERGDSFTMREGKHVHEFEWLGFERLKDEYFYPLFLKTEISRLPEHTVVRTDIE